MKRIVKEIAFRFGVLNMWHRYRNANALTTIMLHRVLPKNSSQWTLCNPNYSLTVECFEQLLDFFSHHYSFVSIIDVLAAAQGRSTLPRNPLLLTFDDGWRDNYLFALPILEARGIPATLFVATGVVAEGRAFWQERLVAWSKSDEFDSSVLKRFSQEVGLLAGNTDVPADQAIKALIEQLEGLPENQIEALIDNLLCDVGYEEPLMLSESELKEMDLSDYIFVAGHGVSHTPFDKLNDVSAEVRTMWRQLTDWGIVSDSDFKTLSFPHGRFDDAVLTGCHKEDFNCLFTSEKVLTYFRKGAARESVVRIGRIDLGTSEAGPISGTKIDPTALAFHLFSAPIRRVACL